MPQKIARQKTQHHTRAQTAKTHAMPKKSSTAVRLGLIGMTVASAAAAYFFLGPKGKKHQKQTKAWAIKMKGDVVEKLETAREVSEAIYHEIIDSVAAEYKKGAKGGSEEINALAQDLKKHWKTISNSGKVATSDIIESVKNAAKKAAH